MEKINSRIKNNFFGRLILSQLKAGYVSFDGFANSKLENTIGTPQGPIISPILCNIHLSDLDKFYTELKDEL